MSSEITLEKIIHPHLLTCPPDTTLARAASMMVEAHYSSILVMDHGIVVGIWTEKDALTLDADSQGLLQTPISRHMSSPVRSIRRESTLGEAALRFREEGVRHFLVTDPDGKPCGIVTQSDIIINQGLEYFIALRDVKSIFHHRHLILPSHLWLRDAMRQMNDGDHEAVIVRFDDDQHGILTERDVIRQISLGNTTEKIGGLASRPLLTIQNNASLFHARKKFFDHKIRHLGVTDETGNLLGLITFADILANIEHDYVQKLRETLREREQVLALSNQYLRLAAAAFESTVEGIMVTDAAQIIESVNPAFTQITGYYSHEVIGKTPAILSSGRQDAAFYRDMNSNLVQTGHWQGEIWNKRRNGEIYAEWLTINAVRDDQGIITHYVAVFSDITSRKQAEEQTYFLAYHDALTSLPNRTLFLDRLDKALALARRNENRLAIFFLDLDNFKQINDTLGHQAGDQMLRIAAQRLVGCVRETDTVARLSGDEFTLVALGIKQAEEAASIARNILTSLAQPVTLEGKTLTISASIGISIFPDHAQESEALLNLADLAMYSAKSEGRNIFQIHGSP